MSKSREIRDKIKAIAGKTDSLFITAKVVSLNEETCTVNYKGTDISDVRISAVVDGNRNNLLIKPKVGSNILLVDLSDGQLRDLKVLACSEVDSITINGGSLGGLCNVPELKIQLEKLSKRVDDMIDAINSPTVVATPQDGGTGLWALFKAQIAQIVDKENFSDIEDETIKH